MRTLHALAAPALALVVAGAAGSAHAQGPDAPSVPEGYEQSGPAADEVSPPPPGEELPDPFAPQSAPAPSTQPVQPGAAPPPPVAGSAATSSPEADPWGNAEPVYHRPKALMLAGWGIFAGSYLLSVLVGLTMLQDDVAPEPGTMCLNCKDVGTRLLIPLVGPFLAIPDADGTDGKVVSALLGVAQVAGLTIAIAGTIQFVVTPARPVGTGPALSVGLGPTGLSLHGRF